MKLIPNWRLAWRFWSVRLNAAGTFLLGLFLVWPEAALTLWGFVPQEARSLLPPRVVMVVPLLLYVAATVAVVIKQRRLDHAQRK